MALSWEHYRSLSAEQREEYNYRFREASLDLLPFMSAIYYFSLFFMLAFIMMLTMKTAFSSIDAAPLSAMIVLMAAIFKYYLYGAAVWNVLVLVAFYFRLRAFKKKVGLIN